jgi:hypothetical protein
MSKRKETSPLPPSILAKRGKVFTSEPCPNSFSQPASNRSLRISSIPLGVSVDDFCGYLEKLDTNKAGVDISIRNVLALSLIAEYSCKADLRFIYVPWNNANNVDSSAGCDG